MGILSSKPYHTDGSTYATKVDPEASAPLSEEEALKQWKTYDYVIVGAGETNSTQEVGQCYSLRPLGFIFQVLLDACLPADCQRTPTSLSYW